MKLLRQHPTLESMLQKEVTGLHNPRQSAAAIMQKTTRAESLVLYMDRDLKWIVIPVGKEQTIKNVGAASRAKVNGKSPVAFCRVNH